MSATRDPSQKHTFVYSNLYQLYRKGKDAAVKAEVPAPAPRADDESRGLEKSRIIKIEEMNTQAAVGIRIARHEPPRLLGKRIEANRAVPAPGAAGFASRSADLARRKSIDGLRDNLRQLQSLHERLRFMLKEIEELSKS